MKLTSVFLDTSFLVASQVQGHTFLKQNIELRERFVLEGCNLYTSPLIFDEFWYVLIGIQKAATKLEILKTNEKTFKQIEKATKNVLSFDNLELISPELDENDMLATLKIMKTYKLRPRDAIIVKIMQKANIKNLATFDYDFRHVRGIKMVR